MPTLLAITINPEACKGCNICVEVCPEQALVTVRQDEEIVEQLRGEAGERQVKNARVGMTQNMGGTGASSVVQIMEAM